MYVYIYIYIYIVKTICRGQGISQGMSRHLKVYLSQGMRATLKPSTCRWGQNCHHPQVIQRSLIWYKSMYISHVFPQSVQSITMVSQTTRYVSCSCFWQTIHLEGRGCRVQSHGVDCQHGGGNLMLYASKYHDINTHIYIYMDTPTWYPVCTSQTSGPPGRGCICRSGACIGLA